MTGWRLGYAVWPEHMVDAADKLAVNMFALTPLPKRLLLLL